ncbi:MAG: bifunctional phosphoribosyl-AMP cyclohydrolase/phosphoribosyl-ATP diphosphatase HisIE [Treponema sp.]|nr:MAG: bifunctional phosphoribosyl-AMP cyclohydrolase/phosphoribosyl-ATP diphosphatase HisIE [Treponema sp.]HQL33619.1 bifunctional phosphoribosyl-AMP cyclohydrolase/phosphoribosyl-ATP diphosphatase HisIE [Treponemataceae bacterium]
MVISSIDLKDGKVVQLRQGKDPVLERDDPQALIAEFDRYGEVAVIDLDAALRNTKPDGSTANTAVLKKLLRSGNVRVGGGIRDAKKAKELISLGAEKVIIGSAAFTLADGSPGINTAFLEAMVQAIGKERIIVSVDSREGKIAVKGWTESAGIELVDGAKAVEQYCSELLFTCVEREGTMTGIDMDLVNALRSAVSCRLVVAGGVSSVQEIAALEKAGCDVQLGMALYTGKVSLRDSFIECLDWDKCELIPVVAQSEAGEVLMVGYANRDAFARTFETGKLTFWSRSRNELWTKGLTSGNTLDVVRLRVDCDRDTVLAIVNPAGPACHTGAWTCFKTGSDRAYSLEFLSSIIGERFANPKPGSYTATLTPERVREKILEEAEELTEAETHADAVWECADLLYFISVLMHQEGVSWKQVLDELDRRHKK